MAEPRVPAPTGRVNFRPYTESDVGMVAQLFADSEIRRFYPTMDTLEAQQGWIEWNLANYRELGFGLWVIEDRGTSGPLGDCGLTLQAVEDERLVEVGYHLLASYRGMGYATEAAEACVAYAFDKLRVESVCSIVDPENVASIAVAQQVHTSQSTFARSDGTTVLIFTTMRNERTSADPRR